MDPAALLDHVAARSVDGLIVAADGGWRDELESLVGRIPIVACDQALFGARCPHVYVDHYDSTIRGLEYLARSGATVIACVRGLEPSCASDTYRRRAYADFAARPDAPTVHQIVTSDDTVRDGYRLLGAVLGLDPGPDAVFTGSDDLAAGLVVAAREEGVSIPHSLAVMGFDDQPIAEVLGITTIRQPVTRMGRIAMELLTAGIKSGVCEIRPTLKRVRFTLVERTSVAKPLSLL